MGIREGFLKEEMNFWRLLKSEPGQLSWRSCSHGGLKKKRDRVSGPDRGRQGREWAGWVLVGQTQRQVRLLSSCYRWVNRPGETDWTRTAQLRNGWCWVPTPAITLNIHTGFHQHTRPLPSSEGAGGGATGRRGCIFLYQMPLLDLVSTERPGFAPELEEKLARGQLQGPGWV